MKKRAVKKKSEIGELFRFVRDQVATKGDIGEILIEIKEIKERLKELEEQVGNHSGHSKEIDHALERIARIEKHVGIGRA
ncbi:MAG: hypothetical protein AAB605_03090 [Patescibacteria group bacterium]